jgi:hypothetical protein
VTYCRSNPLHAFGSVVCSGLEEISTSVEFFWLFSRNQAQNGLDAKAAKSFRQFLAAPQNFVLERHKLISVGINQIALPVSSVLHR